MSGDELSAGESRVLCGIDNLLRGAGAWLTAADVEAHAVRAAAGRAIGGVAAGWFVGGLAYELGPIAWSTAGVVLALSVWVAGAPAATEEEEQADTDGMDAAAFVELVHDVAGDSNVHLTAIAAQLREETGRDWDVLRLCRSAGIPTKPVRVKGADPAVTTGIHRYDLPPLPRPLSTPPVGVVSAGEADNNNTPTPTVTPIGEAGWVHSYSSNRQEARS